MFSVTRLRHVHWKPHIRGGDHLRTWLQFSSHLILTTIGFVLAVGVSVLVNVWTDGWERSVGVGIAVLIGCQVAAEGVRRVMDDPGSEPRKKSTVNQTFGGVRDSEISGINRVSPVSDAEVQQCFKDVHNSTIVGIDEDYRP